MLLGSSSACYLNYHRVMRQAGRMSGEEGEKAREPEGGREGASSRSTQIAFRRLNKHNFVCLLCLLACMPNARAAALMRYDNMAYPPTLL